MYTLTLANIYESQGFKDEALTIYKKVLQNDPSNSEAILAIRKLSKKREHFSDVNIQMKDLFIDMNTEIEFNEFERWLLKTWN
ncbi:MAG: hypothetical protein U9P38_05730 [Campylobacterota bacterium]|nr:hypothetical protein [Campylobacterota bacterium]